MVRYTACGYPALTSFPASFVAPNGHVTDVATPDFAVIMARLWWVLATEIDPKIGVSRGGSTIAQQEAIYRQLGLPTNYTSNHLAGYAVDGDNGRQVFEPNQTGTYRSGYTKAQERAIDAILARAEFGGILQWGHHFTPPYRDPVHFQLMQQYPKGSGPWPPVVSLAKIAAVAKGIRSWVSGVQKACGVVQDGVAGPGTIAAVRSFQHAHGLTVDGIVGAKTQAAMDAQAREAQRTHGNDVSSHQTVAEWEALKPEFLIAKSAEGLSWRDPSYAAHMRAARAARLPGGQGAYIYVWPEYDAKAACRNFLAISGLRKGEWGVIDFEPYSSKSDPATWPAWVCTFATEYRRARGEWPWLYLNDDMATRLLSRANPAQARLIRSLPLWKARYAADFGSLHGWESLTAWQYSGTGVDANWRYSEAHPIPTRTPKSHASKGSDDMPTTATQTFWPGKEPRELAKGWNLLAVGIDKNGRDFYTVTNGGVTAVARLNVSIAGLKGGQTFLLRAREYARDAGGKWVPVKSWGSVEKAASEGVAMRETSVICPGIPAGHRLRWEVYVPVDGCTQTRALTATLTWKD